MISEDIAGVKIGHNAPQWKPYVEELRQNHGWRTSIFVDLILQDAKRYNHELTFLDIGCGRGFDDDPAAQQKLAEHSNYYIGIEPDPVIEITAPFHEIHRCTLEEAPLKADSIDIAWAVMVLEHIENPSAFWQKIYEVLRPGGVFWGFTVDNRHLFPWLVRAASSLGLKDWYLRQLQRKSKDEYEHYPTRYLSNSPRQISPHVQDFRHCDFVNFVRVGQLDGYLPKWARPVGHLLDRIQIAVGSPGILLAIRCEK